jgi:hypothetical protein
LPICPTTRPTAPLFSTQFYLIPYGFDAGSQGKSIKSAVSASEFAKKVQALAKYGKVLLLLDACHSGAVGAQGWATDPDAKVLQDTMDLENVTVLTSSKKNELSEELPEWKHGATPEGFYEVTPGAEDMLKWVVNHGPDNPATTLPVSAIAKLHRPSALDAMARSMATNEPGRDVAVILVSSHGEMIDGLLARAFLDALAGAADSKGIVRLSALTDAMENEVQSLTKGRQHLGMHVNFSADLFVAAHY